MIRLALRIKFRAALLCYLMSGSSEDRERVRGLALRLRECGDLIVRVPVNLEELA